MVTNIDKETQLAHKRNHEPMRALVVEDEKEMASFIRKASWGPRAQQHRGWVRPGPEHRRMDRQSSRRLNSDRIAAGTVDDRDREPAVGSVTSNCGKRLIGFSTNLVNEGLME